MTFHLQPPPEEAELQLELINKSFLQRLLKKIHKRDKITVIGKMRIIVLMFLQERYSYQ